MQNIYPQLVPKSKKCPIDTTKDGNAGLGFKLHTGTVIIVIQELAPQDFTYQNSKGCDWPVTSVHDTGITPRVQGINFLKL